MTADHGSARSLLSLTSGQAHALQTHDRWIVGFGDTSRTELIRRKLLSMNTTSGEVEHIMLPTRNTIEMTPAGEALVPERLFPGYFLLGVTSESPHWQDMKNVEEVYGILRRGERAAFLDEDEIGRIIEMIQEIPHEALLKEFNVGEVVVVTEGTFKGLSGRIEEIRGKRQAKVNIEIRGKTIPTVLALTMMRPRRSGREGKNP